MPAHVVNLNFHGLGEPRRALPPGEEEYWLAAQAFRDILELVKGRDDVRITFDDGNESDATIALPALAEHGLRAEFFLLAGKVDRPGYVTAAQVAELVAEGMDVGLHGMEHRPWPDCDDTELSSEIEEARDRIAELSGRPVVRAACPFGAYDRRTLSRLRSAGFDRVYTSDGGLARRGEWLQCRNTLQRTHDLEWVRGTLRRSPLAAGELVRRAKTLVKRLR
jgi:peptidoglycan/xylan/chitin deacetylase (PgdA/CDA1 family)